ncbi:MAG TPA: winged helix-turn-helix domain-containing protein [Vicinamibacterales bacterium]|nr:winged helix-turn-helix domain-containing protein [Vicinamibacterales bacterium]
MTPERPALERRVLAAVDASPRRIPVLLGGCGSGRTSLLLRLRDAIGRTAAQYVDLERVCTTPERLLRAIREHSPFPTPQGSAHEKSGAREAFDSTLAFFEGARAPGGGAATFLLDEVLELRTFESFPGLRSVLRDLVAALASSPNRFVLTARYVARAHRLLRDAPSQFEVVHMPSLTPQEVAATLPSTVVGTGGDRDEAARAIHALGDGRPAYVRALADAMSSMARHGVADAVSALSAIMAPRGDLDQACRYSYELRLHRARGYGALKAILEVLAEEEPLTLTEIAQRLRRTPGSTKDYLSWLEDVDLVTAHHKRYTYTDPLLRLWVRLHCRPSPPNDDDVAREVHQYALTRLPQARPPLPPVPEPAMALAGHGLIEID